MNRFRLPPRVAPSPASGEPGLQNAAARLRSSREVQARLLEERRAKQSMDERPSSVPGEQEKTAPPVPDIDAPTEEASGSAKDAGQGSVSDRFLAKLEASRKEKLVVLFRLPRTDANCVRRIAQVTGLTEDYVLKSLAKEGRAVLRRIDDEAALPRLTPVAETLRGLRAVDWTSGEPMTVYVRANILDAMYAALGDPWRVTPKATIVGAFFIAIVTDLIEARREP